jgi:predicted nucleic acid-binding protein
MARLIDSSLWVDYFRKKTTAAVLAQICHEITAPQASICDPVAFEILRSARPDQRGLVRRHFALLDPLATPDDLWKDAILLGQRCRDRGFTIGALDLLIATVALAHDAEVISFDADYSLIAQAEPRLRVQVLIRTL